MGSKRIELGSLIILMMTLFWARTAAQSGCTSVLIGMSSCLNYVTGSNTSTPSSSCCSSLASVVKSQPQCLCSALNGDAATALGIKINQTLALALPAACKVQTPPVSRCYANGPTLSPIGLPMSPAASPISPSVSGSKDTKANGATSGGSKLKLPFVIVWIIALYASNFSSF
ncbi:non-specific lipid-transfer protein-like protein [Heracleum sosnowskyi]|uniref:Non-specific lipid-transfer protein-like protein n=1 Tax=Heracleum sosnowskyi TaxID=360622 RepID=A0AAD8MWY1_9APIA|nr:non-specific lipid-transfer protein-like protein [Heracleum sosnowskyi]